jgi:hypothetical protein
LIARVRHGAPNEQRPRPGRLQDRPDTATLENGRTHRAIKSVSSYRGEGMVRRDVIIVGCCYG